MERAVAARLGRTGDWVDCRRQSTRETCLRSLSKPLIAAAVLLGWLCSASTALAQYKWRDGRGQVHASDLPPPREVAEKDILQRPVPAKRLPAAPVGGLANPAAGGAGVANPAATAASAAILLKPPADPELELRRKRAEDEARARARADDERLATLRAENCQRARQQLAALASGRRMERYNERGEQVVLDDNARADELQTAQRVVSSDCR